MTKSPWIAVASLCAVAAGCDGGPDPQDIAQAAAEPERTQRVGLPTGFTCGLAYRRPGSGIHGNNECAGFTTLIHSTTDTRCIGENAPLTPAGFAWVPDGDRGLPSCNGFYHFRFAGSNAIASTRFRVPRGTACGFKEACNDSGERCLGFDANVSCPAGWTQRIASDLNAPNGCGFVWCEYQDPHDLCTTAACRVDNQPFGLTCGITDSDRNNGQCLGQPTTSGCPAGFTRYGFFDDGRSAGHGVGWCAKRRPIIVP